jgi:hypothetical protein
MCSFSEYILDTFLMSPFVLHYQVISYSLIGHRNVIIEIMQHPIRQLSTLLRFLIASTQFGRLE